MSYYGAYHHIKWILILMNQTKAAYQAQRRANPVVRSLEQSANTVWQANACTNQGVWEHESEQQAAAREEPGVQEQE